MSSPIYDPWKGRQGLKRSCRIVVAPIFAYFVNKWSFITLQDLILKELNNICSIVPKKYSEKCKELVKDEGAMIIDMILNQLGPNAICFGLKLCFVDSSGNCPQLQSFTTYL